jgi:hypothetical protein
VPLGALIGAVAGGGKGAATVLFDGFDHLELQRGTTVTITAGDLRNWRENSGERR